MKQISTYAAKRKDDVRVKPDSEKRDLLLSQLTDIDLMKELIARNGMIDAPTKIIRTRGNGSVLIGVGRNHCAELTVSMEALKIMGVLL